MAEVSPMMTQEAGAGPRVKRIEMRRPREACALEMAVLVASVEGIDPAIPRAMRNATATA
jgi:hypothetical protein